MNDWERGANDQIEKVLVCTCMSSHYITKDSRQKTKSPYIKLQGMCLNISLPLRDVGMAIAF